MVSSIARADPSDLLNPSQSATLAPEARFNPFVYKNLPNFQDRTALIYAVGKLRDLVRAKEIRKSHIVRLNNELRDKLRCETIEIDRTIESGSLPSGKKYALAVFNFKKKGKKIRALFLKDYTNSAGLTDEDREELKKFGIKTDTDIGHLDYPGLEGIWFINPGTTNPTEAPADVSRGDTSRKIQDTLKIERKKFDLIMKEAIELYLASGRRLDNFAPNYNPLGKGPYWASSYEEAAMLLSHAGAKEGDAILDVGHGAGDTVSFLAHLFKLRAKGVEIVPEHNEFAVFLRDLMVKEGYLKDGHVVLENKDFMDASIDFSEYDFIYYFCKGTSDTKELFSRLLTVRTGARILMYGSYEPEIENGLTEDRGFVSEIWRKGKLFRNGLARIYTKIESAENSMPGMKTEERPKFTGDAPEEWEKRAEAIQAQAKADLSSAAPQGSHVTAKVEADRIHIENLNCTPTIPDKTILCHIVTNSILPAEQRNMLKTLEQDMRSEKYSEKVVSLSVKDSNSPEEFMKELERIKAQEEARYQGYKVQFDVACPNKYLVGKIQAKGMQALAFSKEGDGDIVQVEGIILALRALQTGSINNLLKVYKFLSGRELTAGTNDVNELARMLLFILPVRKVDVNAIGTLNRIIEENIKTAA